MLWAPDLLDRRLGLEVNYRMTKNGKEMIFDKSWRGRGSQNILSEIEALYFEGFITQSGPTKGLCLFVCTPDPQNVIGMIVNVSFTA